MVDQLTKALTISCIALAVLLLWALSIAFILRDVNRRGLPSYEQVAWVVLAVLIPLIGGIAYVFIRLLDHFFSPGATKKTESEKRITALKDTGKPAKHLPTVAAVDTFQQTKSDLNAYVVSGSASGKRASLYIEIMSGPNVGQRYAIETLPVRIGRGFQTSINLDADQGVSRQHAEIYESSGDLRIRDLNSKHGTYLNGKRITDESLKPGDRLAIGQSTLVFIVEGQDDIS